MVIVVFIVIVIVILEPFGHSFAVNRVFFANKRRTKREHVWMKTHTSQQLQSQKACRQYDEIQDIFTWLITDNQGGVKIIFKLGQAAASRQKAKYTNTIHLTTLSSVFSRVKIKIFSDLGRVLKPRQLDVRRTGCRWIFITKCYQGYTVTS